MEKKTKEFAKCSLTSCQTREAMGIPQLNAAELYFLKKAQKKLSLKGGCMLSKCVLI
jgi:hypothetical protein